MSDLHRRDFLAGTAARAASALHCHPNADEWQYVLSGRASVTLFGSGGRWRAETLAQGDVGYIPQGYGHSIENVGETPLKILVALNAGDYQEIDLGQWMAGNPADVLATNFDRPAATFRRFPTRDGFIE